jgi:hypothetical protein
LWSKQAKHERSKNKERAVEKMMMEKILFHERDFVAQGWSREGADNNWQ